MYVLYLMYYILYLLHVQYLPYRRVDEGNRKKKGVVLRFCLVETDLSQKIVAGPMDGILH